MSFGKCVVYFQCLQRSLFSFRKCLLRRNKTVVCTSTVGIGHAAISQSVGGVFCDGLLKIFDALVESFLASLVPPKAALQVELIGLGICGVALRHALLI